MNIGPSNSTLFLFSFLISFTLTLYSYSLYIIT
nr:MAG TPA: hypothetical protein [Caudoviricetes sp.]